MQDNSMEDLFEEEETHLSEYFMVLSKRKALIILVFLLVVFATAFYTYTTDPIFESSTRLIIDPEKSSSPITGERMNFANYGYASQTMTFNTSIKMIQSTPVILKVIEALKLDAENNDQDLEVNPVKELISQFKANIKLLLKMDKKQELPPEELENRKIQALISMLKGKINVEMVRDTRLLNLSIKDKDPLLAANMANMVARKYMEFTLGNKMESSKQTLEWLNDELYGLRKKLEDDEKKILRVQTAEQRIFHDGKAENCRA